MKEIVKKLKTSKAGFTLAETLIAVLILLMVSAVIGGAIPAASNVFTRTVDAANAQVLLSTSLTVLRNELSTAADIETSSDNKMITYKSSKSGNYCLLWIEDATITLYYGTYDATHDSAHPEYRFDKTKYTLGHYEMISKKAATKGMEISLTKIEKSGNVITVSGLQIDRVVKDSDGVVKSRNTLAGPRNQVIRAIA